MTETIDWADLQVDTRMSNRIKRAWETYLQSDEWKCPKSPNGAHHSKEGVCRYCGARR
jgi:hypothetical protein